MLVLLGIAAALALKGSIVVGGGLALAVAAAGLLLPGEGAARPAAPATAGGASQMERMVAQVQAVLPQVSRAQAEQSLRTHPRHRRPALQERLAMM